MNYDPIDGFILQENLYTFLYIQYTFGFTKSRYAVIICFILKPRIIWINRLGTIFVSLLAIIVKIITIVYERSKIWGTVEQLVFFSKRSNHRSIEERFPLLSIFLPISPPHFCSINAPFFTSIRSLLVFIPFQKSRNQELRASTFPHRSTAGKKACWRNRCSILHRLYTMYNVLRARCLHCNTRILIHVFPLIPSFVH